MIHRLVSLSLLAALAITPAAAQDVVEVTFSGKRTAKAVQKTLDGGQWVNDLAQLKAEAAAKSKLVVWVQIVGELDEGL